MSKNSSTRIESEKVETCGLRARLAAIEASFGRVIPTDHWCRTWVLGLALAAFFMGLQSGDFHFITRYHLQRTPSGILRFGLYLGTYYLQCVLLGKLLFSERNWIRVVGLAMLLPLLALHFSYLIISGDVLGLTEVETILQEGAGYGWMAIKVFHHSILWAFLKATLMVGLLVVASRFFRVRHTPWKTAALALTFPAMLAVFSFTSGSVLNFPVPFRVVGLFVFGSMAQSYDGPRDPVMVAPVGQPYRRNLILIVDESIRGDHLGINGYPRNTTPFLAGLGDSLINFGVCASASNTSAASNAILLTGLPAGKIPISEDRFNRMPTLFDHARKVGMRTVCLDSQANCDSFLLPNMYPSLDRKYTISEDVPKHERDLAGLAWLEAELKTSTSTFFYIIKTGAHFPYEKRVPPSELGVQPFGPLAKPTNRDELVNLYDTVVRWASDEYLRRLYEICRNRDVLVLYTSDHGQSLMDDPRFTSTHGVTRDPNSEQADVPLLALDCGVPKVPGDPWFGMRLKPGTPATHFHIFPTVLRAMGFAEPSAGCARDFFSDAPQAAPRRFFSGGITRKEICFGTGKPLVMIGAPTFANAFTEKPAYCPLSLK